MSVASCATLPRKSHSTVGAWRPVAQRSGRPCRPMGPLMAGLEAVVVVVVVVGGEGADEDGGVLVAALAALTASEGCMGMDLPPDLWG